MRLVNNTILAFFFLLPLFASAQKSTAAWTAFERSKYEAIAAYEDQDAVVIFDRTYYNIVAEKASEVVLIQTIHRKIKINTLYGLELFNKLYISTYSDLEYNLEFVNCKAQVLKADGTKIKTDESDLVTTTLPANAPFFYKKDGEVKMLALNNVSIGDEIEYIYSTRSIFQMLASQFYRSGRASFSNSYLQLEKSVFFESERFDTKIWPYNFSNGNTRDTDFSYENGNKITLENVKPRGVHPYTNAKLEEPYMYFIIADFDAEKGGESWEKIARLFKATSREVRGSAIYDGEGLHDALSDISSQRTTLRKFELVLKKLNANLEDNFNLYDDFKNDIDISWNYAEIISKLMKNQKIPLNFHFVVDKNSGTFDPSYVSIYQFDNILISFLDDQGTKHFMPLLEPFSEMDDVKSEFRNTDCFTIHQSETGKRTFSFEKIPASNLANSYTKRAQINFGQAQAQDPSKDISFSVNEQIIFEGQTFVDSKAEISYIFNSDENEQTDQFKTYIENQVVAQYLIDSVYNVEYTMEDQRLELSYTYDLPIEFSKSAPVISFKLEDVVSNYFYTPLAIRNKINANGYFYEEWDLNYEIEFNTGTQYEWIENEFLKYSLNNTIGSSKGNYNQDATGCKISYSLNYAKDKFAPNDWPNVLALRDQSYDFLNRNLYFRRK